MNDEYIDFNNTIVYNGDPKSSPEFTYIQSSPAIGDSFTQPQIGTPAYPNQIGTPYTPAYPMPKPLVPPADPNPIFPSVAIHQDLFEIRSRLIAIENALANIAESFEKLNETIAENRNLKKIVEDQQNAIDILQTEVESINSDLDDIREKV